MTSAEFIHRVQTALQRLPDEQTRTQLLRIFPNLGAVTLKEVEKQVETAADLAISDARILTWLLGRVGSVPSTPEKLILLTGEGFHPDVRAEALSSLALLIWGTEGTEMVSLFEAGLSDPVPIVATASAHALRAVHNAASVRVLEAAVANLGLLPEVRGYAAESLGEVISNLLESEDAQALTLRDGAEKLLQASCRSPEPEVAYWSVFALELCGTSDSLGTLRKLRGHRSNDTDWARRIEDQVQGAISAIEGRE